MKGRSETLVEDPSAYSEATLRNMVPDSVSGTDLSAVNSSMDVVAPKLYTAIILPTPFSVVSKMVVVLLIFGAYLTGIVFYTLYEGKYHFDGRMMWNFLMDQTDDISYPPAKASTQHVARKAVSTAKEQASSAPSVPSVPSVPFHSATQRARRDIEDIMEGDENFVGYRAPVATHAPAAEPVSWATTWILRPLQLAQMRLMAWTHIRGNTLYSRKIFT